MNLNWIDLVDKYEAEGFRIGEHIARNTNKFIDHRRQEEANRDHLKPLADAWDESLGQRDFRNRHLAAVGTKFGLKDLPVPWFEGSRRAYENLLLDLSVVKHEAQHDRFVSFWGTLGASFLHKLGRHYSNAEIVKPEWQMGMAPSHQGVSDAM